MRTLGGSALIAALLAVVAPAWAQPGDPVDAPPDEAPSLPGPPAPPPPISDKPAKPPVPAPQAALPSASETAGATPPLPPLPPAASDDPHGCKAGWISDVYDDVHRSVVKIETAGALGAGFMYLSPRHVATAFHVVSVGRPIFVTLYSGKTISAEVVAIDPAHDLAILELDEEVKTHRVLELSEDAVVNLGAPLLTIGHPYGNLGIGKHRGLLEWSVSQGVVSGQGPHLIQTDAALNPGNSGGPLLGCDGRVVGVASAKARGEGIGFAVPVGWLRQLSSQVDKQGTYSGQIGLTLSGGVALHGNPNAALMGPGLKLGLLIYDRWEITLKGAQLWDVSLASPPPDVFEQSVSRTAWGASLGYRWWLATIPLISYAGLEVGGMFAYDQSESVQLSAAIPDGCVAGDCTVNVQQRVTETDQLRAWPSVGIRLSLFGFMDAGYDFLPDVEAIGDSVHQGTLGLSLF